MLAVPLYQIHMSLLPSFESTVDQLEIKTNFNGCQRKGGQMSQSDFPVPEWNSGNNLLRLQLSKNHDIFPIDMSVMCEK